MIVTGKATTGTLSHLGVNCSDLPLRSESNWVTIYAR